MAPDVEDLIKRVNTLTLDKSRLKQRLMQLANTKDTENNTRSQLKSQLSATSSIDSNLSSNNQLRTSNNNNSPPNEATDESTRSPPKSPKRDTQIVGIDCSSSCEDDLVYVNGLLSKRLDEYSSNWDLLQSKCSALLTELNALQRRYAILNREKQEVESKLEMKCDDYDTLKNEMQTVVLNYETQLGAMSEHLSSITSQLAVEDSSPPQSSYRKMH